MAPMTLPSKPAQRPLGSTPRTKEEACKLAGERLAAAIRKQDALTIEEAARAAWFPGHRLTIPEIEDKIRTIRIRRGLIEAS